MQYDDDVQLESPLSDQWALPQPEPTNLVAAWPSAKPPMLPEVLVALKQFFGEAPKLLDELDTDASEIQWTAAIQLPAASGLTYPIILWVEPARHGDDHPASAAGCSWVIGVETLLDQNDPLISYNALTRTIAGAFRNVPAILDINTSIWRDRHELQREYLSDPGMEPPAESLWTIHAVQQQNNAQGDCMAWLHTHGLWRCGLPELEMLEVPVAYTRAAAMLLNDVAELLLEQAPSQPHDIYEIGSDLAVTFQPWENIAPYLSDGVPGAMRDRDGVDNRAHTGVRAVVCSTEPKGTYRKLWTWPQEVIHKLQSGDAALYQTQRASERQAKLAQRCWARFQQAFDSAKAHQRQAGFLVKAGFDFTASGESQREHLWLEVEEIDQSSIKATLLNDPVGAVAVRRGEKVNITIAQVSDWQVQTETAAYGPESAEALVEAFAN